MLRLSLSGRGFTKAPDSEPAAAAFAFPFSFLDTFAIGIGGSMCVWHSTHSPYLSWNRVYWLGQGIGLLGASTAGITGMMLAYQHGRRV